VKPVAARFHMKADTPVRTAATRASRHTIGAASQPTSPASVALAWALVSVPLLWGVYETILNAMKLFN